jgi:hypothetical protein
MSKVATCFIVLANTASLPHQAAQQQRTSKVQMDLGLCWCRSLLVRTHETGTLESPIFLVSSGVFNTVYYH